MYVKIANGAVEQYPYTLGDLRRDNPNTSFPRKISAETLASYNLYAVTTQDVPSYDERTQEVEFAEQPSLVDGNWVIVTSVVDKTAEQIADYDLGHATGNRMQRDDLLSQTDWWAMPDSPTMTAEQTAYRQALRDITSHANWPHLEESDWPTKP
jgi:hypothetical protein